MKKQLIFFIVLFALFISISCEKDDNEEVNFYNKSHRIGLWVNPSTKDSLDFVSNKKLIRKGKVYVYEEYEYRIEANSLYVKSNGYETMHKITINDANRITLGNMLFTLGFDDNSSTYDKVKK